MHNNHKAKQLVKRYYAKIRNTINKEPINQYAIKRLDKMQLKITTQHALEYTHCHYQCRY